MRIYTVLIAAIFTVLCAYLSLQMNGDKLKGFRNHTVRVSLFTLTAVCVSAIGMGTGLLAESMVKKIGLFLSVGILVIYTVSVLIKRLTKNNGVSVKPVNDTATFFLVSVLLTMEIFPVSFAVSVLYRPVWVIPLIFGASAFLAYTLSQRLYNDRITKVILMLSGVLLILSAISELILNLL